MKKLLALIMSLLIFSLSAEAKSLKQTIETEIKNANISQSSVSISVKNADNGKLVYELNDKMLMHPASVQKLLTTISAVEVLGRNDNFKTELYSRGKDAYLIKLGADPYLTTSDLESLVSKINAEKVKKIYIDDSILESKDWGEGWQWDDDLNRLMPRFNSYNLDGNITKITVIPTDANKQAFIINPQKSPMLFYNNVITGEKNNIAISRDNGILKLEGTVKTPETYYIPNDNLKIYFEKKLTDALEDRRIYLKAAYSISKKLPNDVLVAEVSHPISSAVDDIFINSNNMVSETFGKLAGGKFYNKQGTDTDAVRLFDAYCVKNNIDNSNVRIVDSSGVSKNNLTNVDFISEFLIKNKNNELTEHMASPSKGTLLNRMIPLKDNLKAKTGTLSDVSAIAGYLTSKSGRKFAFAIMINDPKTNDYQKKTLEDYLIRDMYLKL